MEKTRTRRAFFSVWHKIWQGRDIVEIARALVRKGWEIEASGGTCKHLRAGGIECLDIADRVGEPILGHRVVTLSREFMAGLLAKDNEADRAELAKHGIPWIDMVVCTFYPLQEAIAKEDATPESVIESTDIGGPTMVRAAAKGRRIVVCDPDDYAQIIARLELGTLDDPDFVAALCAKAEYEVTRYTAASAMYHGGGRYHVLAGERVEQWPIKYGENPQQRGAALYRTVDTDPLAVHRFQILEGSQPPSLVNVTDLDRLLQTVTHVQAGFGVNGLGSPKIAVGVKHGNACGASISEDPHGALKGMLAGDLTAIHGGWVMTNFPIDLPEAELLRQHLHFVESGTKKRLLDGVVAPAITPAAFKELDRADHGKCRGVVNPELGRLTPASLDGADLLKRVRGGFLLQPNYTFVLDFAHADLEIVGELVEADKANLILAWAVGCTSNSNTVDLVRLGMLIGNGVGQQDRVFAAQTALARATRQHHKDVPAHEVRGAVAYSDSFFPFTDGPQKLIDAGVRTIFATSGAKRDKDVQEACRAAGVTLVMLPDAKGRGFFGHGV